MATATKAIKSPSTVARKKRSAPKLSVLIAEADDLQKRAAKLAKDLRACRAAGGENAYGGDTTTSKGPR